MKVSDSGVWAGDLVITPEEKQRYAQFLTIFVRTARRAEQAGLRVTASALIEQIRSEVVKHQQGVYARWRDSEGTIVSLLVGGCGMSELAQYFNRPARAVRCKLRRMSKTIPDHRGRIRMVCLKCGTEVEGYQAFCPRCRATGLIGIGVLERYIGSDWRNKVEAGVRKRRERQGFELVATCRATTH